jgi:DNA-binding PadR family transcriptional regulator
MLSKVSTLILGIIEEKPVNPYEITKLLEIINVKDWFSVAASSVYATIKKLHQKDYIKGKIIKKGNMPEKTVYTITENGKKALHETLVEFILDTELDPVKFNIACIMLCHLEKDDALNILDKRLLILKNYEKGIKSHYHKTQEKDLTPYPGLIVIQHNIYLAKVELKITKELISEVKSNHNWNYFLARDTIKKGAVKLMGVELSRAKNS